MTILTQQMADKPTTMHCLKCRTSRNVKDVNLVDTNFVSKKNGKQMSRKTWTGTCEVCGKSVRKFASVGKKPEVDSNISQPSQSNQPQPQPSQPSQPSQLLQLQS